MTHDRLNLAFTGVATFLRSPVCTDLGQLDADLAFLGFPTDEGSGWLPGSRFGPRAVRELSLRFASGVTGDRAGFWDMYDDRRYLERVMAEDRLRDCGDVDVIYTRPDLTWDNGTAAVRRILEAGAFPLVAGGDHAITYPVVRAFEGPLQVVHFDAHLDYQPFVHGVQHSHGNPIRMLRKLENVQRIVQVGTRSFRTAEQDYRDTIADGNVVVTTRDYQTGGVQEILRHLVPDVPVYVSVDVDVLDISLVPGVATPEPSGLTYADLRDALVAIAANSDTCGIDLVELNPMLDVPSQVTAFLTTQLMVEFACHAFARRETPVADSPDGRRG